MPAEGRPEMIARLIMRGVRWASRLTQTAEPLGSAAPKAAPRPRGEIGRDVDVHQAGHAIAPKQRATALRPPDDAEVMTAPVSISLLGQILTPGCTMASSLMTEWSPMTAPSNITARLLMLHGGAHHRAAQLRPLANVGVVPDDAAVNLRAVIDDGVGADDAWAMDDDAALDSGVVAEIRRAEDLRVVGDIDALLDPDAAADILARHRAASPAPEDVGVGAHIVGEIADITPVAVGDVAIDRVAILPASCGKSSWLKSNGLSFSK